MLPRTRRHQIAFRTRSLVTVVLALLLTLQLFPTAGVAAQRPATPLDLAAMVLRPADLVAEGKQEFGIEFGMMAHDPEILGAWPDEFQWDSSTLDAEAFRASGFERGYLLHLSRMIPHESLILSSQLVPTFVLEYDSDAAAYDGFIAMSDAWDYSPTMDRTMDSPGVGDDSLLWTGWGTSPVTNGPIERMHLLFRTGDLVGGIVVLNYSDSDPATEEIMTALAVRQLGHMEEVADRGGPSLGSKIVRLDVAVAFAGYDRYVLIDGILNCVAGEIGSCADNQARDRDFGTVHRYYLNQRIVGHFNEGETTSGYSVTVFVLDDETAATELFQLYAEVYAGSTIIGNLDLASVPALGDESVGVLRELQSFPGRQEYSIAFRTGTTVVQIQYYIDNASIDSQPGVVETINEMAAWQLACLEGSATCADPVPVPAGFVEGGVPLGWNGTHVGATTDIAVDVISPEDFIELTSERD